jgi:hypothetical protein
VHSTTQPEISSSTFGAPGRGLGIWFLLVSSLSMMVQIVEHHAETTTDFLVEKEAVSSTPLVPNRPMPGAATVHATRQYTTAQTSRTPSRVTPGALSAARELLRHSPSSTASPGAMKQWRDDVDRLLGMAHSTSTRSRSRSSRRQHEASASVRSPSVRAHRPTTSRLNSTADAWENTPGSLWKGRASATKTSVVATSIKTSLRLHRRYQCAPDVKRVSPCLAWLAPLSWIISARLHGHLSSDHTCRKSTTDRRTRRSSCGCTSPPSRQQVETPL